MHTRQDLIIGYNLYAENNNMPQLSLSCTEDELSDAIQATDFESFSAFLHELGFTQEEVEYQDGSFLGLGCTAGGEENIALYIRLEDFQECWNY